jgi:RNA polymerase sigma-70 factor (ECF subfamily)
MHAFRPLPQSAAQDPVTSSRTYDDCLVRIATHRDRRAFEALFDHYAPRIKTLLIRTGSPSGAAEDLAQEALLAIWRKADQFDPRRASSAAWIFTIARNLRLDSLRRGSASLHALDTSFGAEGPLQPDAALAGVEDTQRVRAAMRVLNPDQAKAIEMAFFHEQTHLQIAEALKVPLGTIKARIRFGMIRMRAILERETGAQP